MKIQKVIALLSLFIALILISCEKEKEKEDIKYQVVSQTECKSFSLKSYNTISPDSCGVFYNYSSTKKTLSFKHINAGFNCCPGNIYCDISILNDTIKIIEIEEMDGCNCLCLFDIEIIISNIEINNYYVCFYEPYCGNQEKIEFELDLTSSYSGSYFVIRTDYPWAIYNKD